MQWSTSDGAKKKHRPRETRLEKKRLHSLKKKLDPHQLRKAQSGQARWMAGDQKGSTGKRKKALRAE